MGERAADVVADRIDALLSELSNELPNVLPHGQDFLSLSIASRFSWRPTLRAMTEA
jgi:hypothetical protein